MTTQSPFPGLDERWTKPAYVMADTGYAVTYGELEGLSNRGAHALYDAGLRPGDHIAMMLENHPSYFKVYWAAMRAGLIVTPISTHLKADEAAYIVNDCAARVLVASSAMKEAMGIHLLAPKLERLFCLDEPGLEGFESWFGFIADKPETPLPQQTGGIHMFYSSGTTGRPKGIVTTFSAQPVDMQVPYLHAIGSHLGFGSECIYLSPAPLYHSAPLGFTAHMMRLGATAIIGSKFDPEGFLATVQRYKVTHCQVVPTMFVRMLKLPPDVRTKYDCSSLSTVVHAAAPCPVEIKQQMLDWWGPVLYDFYGGSEGIGLTVINSQDWLTHKGSVGRPVFGEIKILDEDDNVLPPGMTGRVYFAGAKKLVYHNDPDKTREAQTEQGWATMGDIGHVDSDGFLYLTDRAAYTIISGGVNIYPQEIEDVLTMHPMVADAAVFGVPNPEFGEEVKAVIQLQGKAAAGPALAEELMIYCRSRLSAVKCPRSIDFIDQLPREENGKLYKRKLRDKYWAKESA